MPDSHRTLTLKYCLMHFYQSIHTVWARSTLMIKSKDILLSAMSLSVSVSGRCESYFLLSRAQIIAKSVRRVSESLSGSCEYTSYFELSVSVRCESGLKWGICLKVEDQDELISVETFGNNLSIFLARLGTLFAYPYYVQLWC